MNKKYTVADCVKDARLQLKYTQQQLADVLNVRKETISHYETGKTLPDITVIIKLAKLCNCTTDEILKKLKHNVKASGLDDIIREFRPTDFDIAIQKVIKKSTDSMPDIYTLVDIANELDCTFERVFTTICEYYKPVLDI